jgi:lysophospholipase L1-like esterase
MTTPSENIVNSYASKVVSGVGAEIIEPIAFDCAEGDFILYAKGQLSGLSGGASFISIETADKSKRLEVGFGYDFRNSVADISRISMRVLNGSSNTSNGGVSGVELVTAAFEIALHYDCDRGAFNLWRRDTSATGYRWIWENSIKATGFDIEQIRFWNRTSGASAQVGTFTEVAFCKPSMVAIGDSVTAGHNGFDPNPDKYEGRDNGLSQWEAYCWPYPDLRNNIIVSKGIGGNTTAMVNARISEAFKHGNQLVFLSVQNNDYGAGITLQQRTDNIQSSLNACVNAGCEVVLIGALYSNKAGPGASYYMQWRDEYLSQITGHEQYIEIMEPVKDPATGRIKLSLTCDNKVHPNVAGYTLIGQYIQQEKL